MNDDLYEALRSQKVQASRRWGWELWFAAAIAIEGLLR